MRRTASVQCDQMCQRLKNVPLNSYVSIYAPAGSSHESSRETVGDTLQPQELMNPEDILIDKENVTDLKVPWKSS